MCQEEHIIFLYPVVSNCILRDMCQEEHIIFLDHENIDAQKHLNNSKLHLNRYGESVLANIFLNFLCA